MNLLNFETRVSCNVCWILVINHFGWLCHLTRKLSDFNMKNALMKFPVT